MKAGSAGGPIGNFVLLYATNEGRWGRARLSQTLSFPHVTTNAKATDFRCYVSFELSSTLSQHYGANMT